MNNREDPLKLKPVRREDLLWNVEEKGVVLQIENKGFANKLAQLILKKPKISYIHLDEMGSFIWPLLDGDKTVFEIGEAVKEKFGDAANPLYERLNKYIKILKDYNFIYFKD